MVITCGALMAQKEKVELYGSVEKVSRTCTPIQRKESNNKSQIRESKLLEILKFV